MGPAGDGSDNDRDSGIRRTNAWRGEVPLQEMAARLSTTTDPLLTEMFNLGLRYDQRRFYQRQEGGEGAARREMEISAEMALALLRPRFTDAGAADESGDPTVPLDDAQILSTETAPLRGPPSAPPFRRERLAGPEEPSVRVSKTYVGQVDQLARQHKLEELHLALSGNDPVELIRKALTDYLTLVPTNEKPDEGDITNFFDAVKARGREIVGHYTSQLELLLKEAPEAAGHFAVEAASNLYFDLSAASVEEFVREGLQAADKVGYFSIQSDVGKRAFEKLFIDEHERLVRGEAAAREANLKRSVAVADALLNGEREASPPLAGPPRDGTAKPSRGGLFGAGGMFGPHYDWRKGFLIISAGAAALSLWAGYLHMDRNTYRDMYEHDRPAIAQLGQEHRKLEQDYAAALEANKALQEGPQGQGWKKREQEWGKEYAGLERRANDAERDVKQYRERVIELEQKLIEELKQKLTQRPPSWGEKIRANVNDSQALRRIAGEYISKSGGIVALRGPGCDRAVASLHQLMGGSAETKQRFVESTRPFCASVDPQEEYVTFRTKK